MSRETFSLADMFKSSSKLAVSPVEAMFLLAALFIPLVIGFGIIAFFAVMLFF